MSKTNPTNWQQQQQQQASSLHCFHHNSFISSSSLQLHSHDYTGAKQTSLFGFRPWQQATQQPCRTPAMLDAGYVSNSNNWWVRIYYLSCVCFHCIYCFGYSLTRVCLFARFSQQSFIINNNVDASAIKSIANTSFPLSAARTPQQLQPEHEPTMAIAIAIAKYKPMDSCDPSSNQQHLQMKFTTMMIGGQQQQQ